jgi:hypothetical protein
MIFVGSIQPLVAWLVLSEMLWQSGMCSLCMMTARFEGVVAGTTLGMLVV